MIYNFETLFIRFIVSSHTGRHKQLNGRRLRKSVIAKYRDTLHSIVQFKSELNIDLHICDLKKAGKNLLKSEIKRWDRISAKYAKFLFQRGCFDNYVSSHFKIIKVFFRYLTVEKLIDCTVIINCFKSVKEQIPIIVLEQKHIAFLTGNEKFAATLNARFIATKDIFVVGCFVGLRFGDLMNLRPNNIECSSGGNYLRVTSGKTNTETILKLPDYVITIFNKYKKTGKLLPQISNSQLNKNIKLLCEAAGWTSVIGKSRNQEGIPHTVLKNGKPYRFCDLITTHTMRRTAITNLLLLGVPELMVRQISGHAPGSKAFYRYVSFAQQYLNSAIDLVHERMNALIDAEKSQSKL